MSLVERAREAAAAERERQVAHVVQQAAEQFDLDVDPAAVTWRRKWVCEFEVDGLEFTTDWVEGRGRLSYEGVAFYIPGRGGRVSVRGLADIGHALAARDS